MEEKKEKDKLVIRLVGVDIEKHKIYCIIGKDKRLLSLLRSQARWPKRKRERGTQELGMESNYEG